MDAYPGLTPTQVQDTQRLERILRMTVILARAYGHYQGIKMANYVKKLMDSQLTLAEFVNKVNELVGQRFEPKILELFEANLPHLRAEIQSKRLDIDSIIMKAVGQ